MYTEFLYYNSDLMLGRVDRKELESGLPHACLVTLAEAVAYYRSYELKPVILQERNLFPFTSQQPRAPAPGPALLESPRQYSHQGQCNCSMLRCLYCARCSLYEVVWSIISKASIAAAAV
jgi:hypothetical protein